MMKALLLAAALATIATAGCGDGPICQSEILLVIQSPSGLVLGDSNATMAGTQTQVVIRSTLPEGVDVVLQVLDGDHQELGTATAATDADGNVTFDDVTLPGAATFLAASADAGECGSSEDEVAIDVVVGGGCAFEIRQTPIVNAFYAPLGVLNHAIDPVPGTPGFEADLDVTARAEDLIEVFVTDATGSEISEGSTTADATGAASFPVTLTQGRESIRLVCRGADGGHPSTTTSVFVDTVAPSCAITQPAPGTTITPALDQDGDLGNGVQLVLDGHASGADVEGEPASFDVTVEGGTVTVLGSALDPGGNTSAIGTVDPASVPSTATLVLHAQDHAGNSCSASATHDVVYDGCSIAVTAPSATVTADADGNPGNGAQVDVTLAIDPACAGRTVTSSCGLDDPSATVAGDGSATVRVGWCGADPCEHTASCTFTVTSSAGIATSAGATIAFDDAPPPVGVTLVDPAVACGAQVTAAVDVDSDPSNGVQVIVRVVSPLAATRNLQQTDAGGTTTFNATSDVTATISGGTTTFVGIAGDAVGNTAQSSPCTLTL